MLRDTYFMQLAIEQAKKNASYPFGAVLVHRKTEQVVATGFNRGQENPIWHGGIDATNHYAALGVDIDWLVNNGWNQIHISSREIVDRSPFARCAVVGGVLVG